LETFKTALSAIVRKLPNVHKSTFHNNQKVPVISALGRTRQEDLEFEASLGYIVRLCLKKIRVIIIIINNQKVETK
jgi:hypothetical protein